MQYDIIVFREVLLRSSIFRRCLRKTPFTNLLKSYIQQKMLNSFLLLSPIFRKLGPISLQFSMLLGFSSFRAEQVTHLNRFFFLHFPEYFRDMVVKSLLHLKWIKTKRVGGISYWNKCFSFKALLTGPIDAFVWTNYSAIPQSQTGPRTILLWHKSEFRRVSFVAGRQFWPSDWNLEQKEQIFCYELVTNLQLFRLNTFRFQNCRHRALCLPASRWFVRWVLNRTFGFPGLT